MADQYDDILKRQLQMNSQTWAALQAHGVTPESQVRLDFSYHAPGRDAAQSLVSLVRNQTDYDVQAKTTGSLLNRKWRVEGTTQSTVISLEILDQWVTWMVTAGKEQGCDFDGWGALV
jgi:Regulator of ribonuclease activity B